MVDEDELSRIKSVPRRTRGRPRLADVADLERELLDVALNEFLKSGYGGTSMATIVKAAGVSKTTLYSRFSSKRELFLAIVQKLISSKHVAHLVEIEEGPLELEVGLKAYGNRALEFGSRRMIRGLDRLICSEAHRFPELGEAATRQVENAVAVVSDFIAKCAVAENIPCANPNIHSEVFVRMLRGFQVESLFTGRESDPVRREKFVDHAVHMVLVARKDW